MWIAEAEGVEREAFDDEEDALRHAQGLALRGKRAVVWELDNDERETK